MKITLENNKGETRTVLLLGEGNIDTVVNHIDNIHNTQIDASVVNLLRTDERLTLSAPANSDWIERLEYQPATKVLSFWLEDGQVMAFRNVPFSTFVEGMNSESTGKFFHHTVKLTYDRV